jgi:hypothetical protein
MQKIGGGFGQTLAIADVNGDDIDDILVGAPNTYLDETNRNRIIYDVGAVHIFYGTGSTAVIFFFIPIQIYSVHKCTWTFRLLQ